MKKVYLTPHTEAIKLLGENAIMAGSYQNPNVYWGGEGYTGEGQ